MKKSIWTAGLLLCAALTLSACSGADKKEEDVKTTEESSQEEAAGAEAAKVLSLGEYKGIKVSRRNTEVTDQEVEAEISSVLSASCSYREVEGRTAVETGDVVNIDYAGKMDGVAFAGGTAAGFDLEIGSGQFINGFEDQLIGKEIGGPYVLDLTFPDPYPNNPDLAGKAVQFEVTVNKIQEKIEPELTDAFVKENLGKNSVEEYRAYVKEQLQTEKQQEAQAARQNEVLEKLIEASEFSVDQKAIEAAKDEMINSYEQYAQQYGMELEAFAAVALGASSLEELEKQCLEIAELRHKREAVLLAVANAEKITLEDKDYQAYTEKVIAEVGLMSGIENLEQLEQAYGKDMLQNEALYNKAQNYLIENSVEE